MYSLSAHSATELFSAGCQAIRTHGAPTAPRGLPTTELLGAHLRLSHPRHRWVEAVPARILNPAFATAEAIWILSGSDDSWIFTFNERLRRFTDHGRLQGAYGPRLRRWRGRDQLDAVRRVLEYDGDSRQAVIQLFDPARDFSGYPDVPCTLGYRFYIRNDRLEMFTSMRSQDVWLGLPYDIFTTTILHELLAGWLDVELGHYHHLADSLHLYDDHVDLVNELSNQEVTEDSGLQPALAVPWNEFDELLEQVAAGETVGHPGWDSIAVVLSSYRAWKQGNRDEARDQIASSDQPLPVALRGWYALLDTDPSSIAPPPAVPTGPRGRRV